jgi:hypothetical protein
MTTFLRELYDVLSCFSTATHTEMCNDLLRQLTKGKRKRDNLAVYFSDALEVNKDFNQIEQPFFPDNRGNKTGTNPVAKVMKKSPLKVVISSEATYEFTFLHREIPHLRAKTKKEQSDKAWIDYVARTKQFRPILGEIKWKGDKNPFYAFVQLLTYLSEMATPNQIERSVKHALFGEEFTEIEAFDLHIFLGNFNDRGGKDDRGGKEPLIDLTRQLASEFKKRLQEDHPEAATFLGDVLCLSGHIENGRDSFSDGVRCLWMV